MNLLEVHNEFAKKYAQTIDKASFQYITGMIDIIRERGDDPADYELSLVSSHPVKDSLTTEWTLRIRKIGEGKLVD
ncbi:hypothetical protein [Polynucleobacter sp.]|uniref:hypothetical protein n=1 Tax=Polynucleobacter sp. TaxID=2029855 RepID=UPI003F69E707